MQIQNSTQKQSFGLLIFKQKTLRDANDVDKYLVTKMFTENIDAMNQATRGKNIFPRVTINEKGNVDSLILSKRSKVSCEEVKLGMQDFNLPNVMKALKNI